MPIKTRDVLNMIGVASYTVDNLLRRGRLSPLPKKDSSGDLVWTDDDVERLRVALAARRPYKKAAPAV